MPYNNNSLHDVKDYYEKDRPWIHSRRGNWHRNYWDKTANQAYHFWGFVAFSYVDGSVVAHAGNLLHDSPIWQEEIDFRDETKAPPILGYTKEDWNLSLRGIELGSILKRNSSYAFIFECEDNPSLEFASKFLIYPGNWIRANLKDPAISVEHGR